jgi:RNA polymerase sigma-70 factor, ECF subfamily
LISIAIATINNLKMDPGFQPEPVISEADIISRSKNNIVHFEPLYDKYYPAIFRFINRKMESREDAADLTSNVFLKAMTSLSNYRDVGLPFQSWLMAIARHEVAGFYRKAKSMQRYYASLEGIEQIARDTEYEPTDGFFPLKKILELIPPKDFELIELKYFEKKSVREISLITGMNENRIRVRMHRIRERMGRMIRKKGIELMAVTLFIFCILL